MEVIYIPQLARAPEQTERVIVNEHLPGLESLMPVQGEIRVTHRGNYLEVEGRGETIVTLTCDRCLQQYNHRIAAHTTELIWLQKSEEELEPELEREIAFDDLVETLDPDGEFQPLDWLYQQLCLAIPPRQLCDSACAGIQVKPQPEPPPVLDRRWASLHSLQDHFQQN